MVDANSVNNFSIITSDNALILCIAHLRLVMFDETPAINFSNTATVMPQIQKEKRHGCKASF